jgi:hypothetical protein
MVNKKGYYIKNEDGIYPEIIVDHDELTEDERAERLRSFATPDFNTQLADILDYVKEIQKYYRTNKPVNHTEKEFLSNARHVESMITRELPGTLARGAINSALRIAFNIGRITEKIYVLPFEADVIHSRRSIRGLNKGRDEKKRQTNDRYADIRSKVQSALDANPKNTLNHARDLVAKEILVSFETVKRATAGMKPRNKIKK